MTHQNFNEEASRALADLVAGDNRKGDVKKGRASQKYREDLLSQVRTHLQNGADPNIYVPMPAGDDSLFKFSWNIAPMEMAVKHFHPEMIGLLAEYGGSPHIKKEGQSLIAKAMLMALDATDKVRAGTIKALLECGANPNQWTECIGDMTPPLHIAAQGCLFECMKALVGGGADVSAINHTKSGIFHGDALTQLLGRGVSWFTDAKPGDFVYDESGTPLFSQKMLDPYFSVVDTLLSKMNPVARRFSVANAVLCATSWGISPAVRYLVEHHGADINGIGIGAEVPLCRAASTMDSEVMHITKSILGFPGIDLNRVNENGKTALQVAIDRGNSAVVMLLVEAGADLTRPMVAYTAAGARDYLSLKDYCVKRVKNSEIKGLVRALLARKQLAGVQAKLAIKD